MSAPRIPAKRPAGSTPKLPNSPSVALTPKSYPAPGRTPTSQAGTSPERSAKRARLSQGSGQGEIQNGGLVPPSLAQVGRGVSTRGGVAWVQEKVAELGSMYKECLVAATLLLQYRTYSRDFGIGTKRTPVHLSQRLELAWTQYESLRSHIESYLLQCAQAATPNSTAKPLPTPSSLVPGLPPLPSIPSIPLTALTLLQADPHPGRLGRVSLDKLLAADPAKGLVGYTSGEVVFPGVPSDVAMPVEEIRVAEQPNPEPVAMSISLPGVDYSAQAGMGGDDGMDLTGMGIEELSALINGDALMSGLSSGMGQQGQGAEAAGMLDDLNRFAQSQAPVPLPLPVQAQPVQQQAVQNMSGSAPGLPNREAANALLAEMQQNQAPARQVQQPPAVAPAPISSSQPLQQAQQPYPPAPPPVQSLDFAFPTMDTADSLDPLDGLGDIDFNELAGMFTNASGRTTRQASPDAASQPLAPITQSDLSVAQLPVNPAQQQPDQLGLDMSSLYPVQDSARMRAADFDGTLGGIDLNDFNFGGDGEGSLPGVDGDEFESMFAEFK